MKLTIANAQAIRYSCLHFHYAKSVPSVMYGFNVYNNKDEWCGTIDYGIGATSNIASPFGLNQGEVLELVRVTLNGKQETTSQCVAESLRKLHQMNPIIKLIVSYADCDQNHFGTIYQATNWLFLGKMNEGNRSAFIINGKKVHPRTVGSAGIKQSLEEIRKHLDKNATEFHTAGKYKYVYPFDKKIRKRLLKETKPYPKKDG